MTRRTALLKVRQSVSLREGVSRLEISPRADGSSPVDREKGVIRGVKISGLVSANGRKYLPEAFAKALSLYEGVTVRIDHPRRPDDSRESDDVFGWFRDVRLGEDGCPYGDLHYLKSHPMAARVCEAVERNSRLYGMSHNANGDGDTAADGTFVVREITEVRSVDLVADPATTSGLFESTNRSKPVAKKKIKAVLEGVLAKLTAKQQPILKKLLEDDGMSTALAPEMDEPMAPADGTEADPNAALKDGFHAACLPLLDAALDGDVGALKQLQDFVKTHAKIAAKPEKAEEPVEEEEQEIEERWSDGTGADNRKEEKGMFAAMRDRGDLESIQRDVAKLKEENAALQREKRARELCEEAKVQPDKILLEALASAKDEPAMKRLVEREKTRAQPGQKPRSQSPAAGQPVLEGKKVADAKGFLNALRN